MFCVLDSHHAQIPSDALNKEVLSFWEGVEYDSAVCPKDYSRFDSYTNIIDSFLENFPKHATAPYKEIFKQISRKIGEQLLTENTTLSISLNAATASKVKSQISFYQPYMSLLNNWAHKGYKIMKL